MGLFKKFVKEVNRVAKEANKVAAQQQEKQNQTTNSSGHARTSTNKRNDADYSELLALYKTYNFPDNLDVKKQIAQVNPHADEHTCPYCGVIHDFTATRARKCPDCKNKMVVRHGHFLTEEQVDEMETNIANYYDKRSAWSQLEYSLRNAQNAKVSSYGSGYDYPAAIAESFRHAAKLKNTRDAKGLDYWDKSWSYFNEARVLAANDQYQPYYYLSHISYNMADMLVEQAKSTKSVQSKRKVLRTAFHQIVMSIGERTKEEDWNAQSPYVYERAKLIMHHADMTITELDEVAAGVSRALRLSTIQTNLLIDEIQKIKGYELIGDKELH